MPRQPISTPKTNLVSGFSMDIIVECTLTQLYTRGIVGNPPREHVDYAGLFGCWHIKAYESESSVHFMSCGQAGVMTGTQADLHPMLCKNLPGSPNHAKNAIAEPLESAHSQY